MNKNDIFNQFLKNLFKFFLVFLRTDPNYYGSFCRMYDIIIIIEIVSFFQQKFELNLLQVDKKTTHLFNLD